MEKALMKELENKLEAINAEADTILDFYTTMKDCTYYLLTDEQSNEDISTLFKKMLQNHINNVNALMESISCSDALLKAVK